jgi:hypothetical protein
MFANGRLMPLAIARPKMASCQWCCGERFSMLRGAKGVFSTAVLTIELVFSCVASSCVAPRAQPTPDPNLGWHRVVTVHCGSTYSPQVLTLTKAIFADEDASDYTSEATDSRLLIRKSVYCFYNLPTCDASDAACNMANVSVNTEVLFGEESLAEALYKSRDADAFSDAFDTTLTQAVYLCNFPNIASDAAPYELARMVLRLVLEHAARLYRDGVTYPIDSHVSNLEICAHQIDPGIKWTQTP